MPESAGDGSVGAGHCRADAGTVADGALRDLENEADFIPAPLSLLRSADRCQLMLMMLAVVRSTVESASN